MILKSNLWRAATATLCAGFFLGACGRNASDDTSSPTQDERIYANGEDFSVEELGEVLDPDSPEVQELLSGFDNDNEGFAATATIGSKIVAAGKKYVGRPYEFGASS